MAKDSQIPKHHTFRVVTRRRHGTSGSSGYSIKCTPPLSSISNGEDIEGIGWVPHRGGTKATNHAFLGWFRYRDAAKAFETKIREGKTFHICQCQTCEPEHPHHQKASYAEIAAAAIFG